MYNEAIHHLIISIDAPGSGQLSNPEKLELRNVIYQVIDQAFREAEVADEKCPIEDRGDGALIIVPPTIPETRMIGVWIEEVHQALRVHNGTQGTPRPIRLRLGAHSGQVHTDTHGAAGADVDLACRLADSGAARATLSAAHAGQLVVIVSNVLYESVVRHGGRFIDPECYRQVRVQLKETDTTAWVAVPGYSVPPIPPEDANPSRTIAEDRAQRDSADPQVGADRRRQVFGDIHHSGGNAAYIGEGTFKKFVVGDRYTGTENRKEERQ